MKKLIPLVLLLLSGCTTFHSPIPENYQGPISNIESSEKRLSGSKADLFYVSKVDGKSIYNSMNATRGATYGQGFTLTTQLVNTQVPSIESIFTLVGRTEYAAPIQALTGTVYEVKGNIKFTPKPGKTYIVKGELGEKYSAVWIELKENGEVVDKKIEMKGDAELGFFQK